MERPSRLRSRLTWHAVDSMWMWKAIDVDFTGVAAMTVRKILRKVIEGMSFSETADIF
ncbi:MAG: hypothetical protein ACLR8P_08780 [Clostridium fessum]